MTNEEILKNEELEVQTTVNTDGIDILCDETTVVENIQEAE